MVKLELKDPRKGSNSVRTTYVALRVGRTSFPTTPLLLSKTGPENGSEGLIRDADFALKCQAPEFTINSHLSAKLIDNQIKPSYYTYEVKGNLKGETEMPAAPKPMEVSKAATYWIGVLTSKLNAGKITQEQYQKAVGRLLD